MNYDQLRALTDNFEGCEITVSVGRVDIPGVIEGNGTAEYAGKDADFLLVADMHYHGIVTWVPIAIITSFDLVLGDQ